jgi:hypothetical protein
MRVSKHFDNIFATNELVKVAVISILETTATALNADFSSEKITIRFSDYQSQATSPWKPA